MYCCLFLPRYSLYPAAEKTKSETKDDPDTYQEQVKAHITDEDYKTVTVISGKALEIGESYSFKRLWNDAEYRSSKPEVASVDKN